MLSPILTQVEPRLADLTVVLKKDYQLHGKPFNSFVDRHWNGRGHAIVAQIVSSGVSKISVGLRTHRQRGITSGHHVASCDLR